MDKVVRISKTGGPEVIELADVEVGAPGTSEVRIAQSACGVNYIDTYHRNGLYPQPLPSGLGVEAAGTVEAAGPGVTGLAPGDRVAYCTAPIGAYASARIVPASVLVKLPDAIGFETAAGMMLKGLTAQYLFRRTYPLHGGETILFHAAAGGVGLIACQWARALGVTMIGTVGSDEKAALARAHGCTHVINYRKQNFVERVKEITGGRGVPVVYDGVGKDTFTGSLDCLARFGMLVSYGNASGPVPPFSLVELSKRGSLYITRPSLFHHADDPASLPAMADELFAMVTSGRIGIEIGARYALADAAQAHRDLEARKTTGSCVLIP